MSESARSVLKHLYKEGRMTEAQYQKIDRNLKERPHGEWIKHVDDLFPVESTEECSVCHEEQRITGNDNNFCPNCGADMRKEGDEK